MGRPKTHDEHAAAALLDAAEALVDAGGPGAVSVRRVAERSGTTTRAVYSLFGSKAGLLAALGTRMFQLLGDGVAALAETDDPAADLVMAGVGVFRRLSVTRPGLFQIGVMETTLDPTIVSEFVPAASEAWSVLESRFARLQAGGGLPGRTPATAARQFDALCEGLVLWERRCGIDSEAAQRAWCDALFTLLDGMALPPRSGSGR